MPLRNPLFPILAAVTWNIGIAVGVLSILAGATTGKELLEFPPYAAFILFLGLVIVGLWALTIFWAGSLGRLMFRNGISWAHFCGSPGCIPLRISCLISHLLQGLRSRRSIGGMSAVWSISGLTPIALAAAYYLIPKTRRPPDL